MGRKKQLADDAEPTTVYLTPEEQLVLPVIEKPRKKRKAQRATPSQLIADALWRYLIDVEKISRQEIIKLLAVNGTDRDKLEP